MTLLYHWRIFLYRPSPTSRSYISHFLNKLCEACRDLVSPVLLIPSRVPDPWYVLRSWNPAGLLMTQHGVLPSWQCMPDLARGQRSGVLMVVHPILTGGSVEGSPQLQHELIIPQWKTAEGLMREKVRPKALIFRGKS